MVRNLRSAGVVLAVLLLTGPLATPAMADDGDGDGLEDAVATYFFPYVWFDSGEDCTDPATGANPGTAQRRERARIRSEKGIRWGGRPITQTEAA